MSGALADLRPARFPAQPGTRARMPAALPPLGSLTVEVPAAGVPAFLAAPVSGEALFWAPPAGDADAWTFAGRGIAARIDPPGLGESQEAAVAAVREQSVRIFASIHGADDEPPVRLFGGFAFRADERAAGPWAPFGAASFALPRLLYAERGGRAWLRAHVPLDRGGLGAAVPELYRLRAFLARAGAVPPLPPVVEVEEISRGTWDCRVADALAAVRGGSLSKVVLARRSRVVLGAEASVAALAASLPAEGSTRFAFGRGSVVFAGATPERLVTLRERRVRCDALGGSVPRGGDRAAEASALLQSAKDGREHAEVVAGIRASLAPLATALDAEGPRVRTLATVHHLHTEVTGDALPGTDVLSLLEALHPTPAVCGTPREAARAWISAHEGPPRGWYAGPVGWIDAAGEGSFCVALRCALLHGREAWLYAGAGLVDGSDPAAEWRETAAKQAPMLRTLGART